MALIIGMLGVSGCESARVEQPLTAQALGDAPGDQLDFWHTLVERPVVSHDEAFHAMLLFLDGTTDAQSYEQRVDLLKSRGILPASFDREADLAVTRGVTAVMLVNALDIDGGVIMRVFGPSERYATRELNYLGLYPVSGTYQTFSGEQFVSMIGLAEDYQRYRAPTRVAASRPVTEQLGGGEAEAQAVGEVSETVESVDLVEATIE